MIRKEQWFCKRHNVDHYGQYCSGCVESDKRLIKRLRAQNKALERVAEAAGEYYDRDSVANRSALFVELDYLDLLRSTKKK